MDAQNKEVFESVREPLVSVLVPCFNYGAYVGSALKSILSQNYPAFELIVVDDGSVDDSVSVIEAVLEDSRKGSLVRRVEFFKQKNCGVSAALNLALKHARGEYVATFDADDVMTEGRLLLQVEYLQRNLQTGCVGGAAVRIDEEGRLLPRKEKERTVRRYDFAQALAEAFVVGGGVAMYRREVMEMVGGYDADIKIQDFQMTLKIAGAGFYVDVIPDVVTLYRKHEGSLSRNYKAEYFYGEQLLLNYKWHPSYSAAKVVLVSRALRLAVFDDREYAWSLFKSVPLRQWNRKMFRRFRHFLFKRKP